MAMHLMRQFGAPAWIVEAAEFPHFLDMAYTSHFGEIWLYNNDLRVISGSIEDSFRSLYLERVAGHLAENIDAVKILVGKDYEKDVFDGDRPCAESRFMKNIRMIWELPDNRGRQRLESFYFGKMTGATLGPELEDVPTADSWMFYTHRGCLDKNSGIIMVRQESFPFGGTVTPAPGIPAPGRFALVWRLAEAPRLQERLQGAFQRCFTDADNFVRLDVSSDDPFNRPFVPGWSTRTVRLKEDREQQACEGLMLGDKVDVAVVASHDWEIAPLENALGAKLTPIRGDPYTYALLRKRGDTWKILLANIGEDNLASASGTWDIIEKWNPDHVILVGVAGGAPTDESIEVGDLVIAECIIGYEHGTWTEKEGFKSDHTKWPHDRRLYATAARVARTWPGTPIEGRPEGAREMPVIHMSPVASGSKLVASKQFFVDHIQKKTSDKIVATEMEGDGVGYACENHPRGKRGMLLVKCIMDKSDRRTRGTPERRRARKRYACDVAARFVCDLLHQL